MLQKLKSIPTARLVGITVLVVVLASAGAAYWFLVARPARASQPKPKNTVVVPLGDFTTNLALTEGLRQQVIRLSLEVEVPDNKAAREVNSNLSLARDAIIVALRSITVHQLNGAEGIDYLRTELIGAINRQLPKAAAINVYFTDIIVQ